MPRGIGENAREAGGRGARQSDADPRLDDRVTALASACRRIDLDPVQRVRDGFDQPARRVGRQLRVGIERDDVGNRQRQVAGVRDMLLCCPFAAQERVQLFQFSAFAFAADPALLAFGPHARPVKQQEAVALDTGAERIPRVQIGDPVAGGLQQFRVVGCRRFRRIREIGKEAVENVVVAVAEKSNLQLFDFSPYRLPAGQHHRNHHQRGVRRRECRSKIQFGQRLGGQQRNHQRVDDLNAQFAEREYRERRQRDQESRSVRLPLPAPEARTAP